jgi:hypothetical protein
VQGEVGRFMRDLERRMRMRVREQHIQVLEQRIRVLEWESDGRESSSLQEGHQGERGRAGTQDERVVETTCVSGRCKGNGVVFMSWSQTPGMKEMNGERAYGTSRYKTIIRL